MAKIYNLSKSFPKEEIYGIVGQIRRAVVSIPANISEGASRNTKKEYVQFLYIALGSASEVETHLIVAQRIGFISAIDEVLTDVENIKKMLNGLISFLKKKK